MQTQNSKRAYLYETFLATSFLQFRNQLSASNMAYIEEITIPKTNYK